MDDLTIDKARKRCRILDDVDWDTLCASAQPLADVLRRWAMALEEHNFNPVLACTEATDGKSSWNDLTNEGRDSWTRYSKELREVASG